MISSRPEENPTPIALDTAYPQICWRCQEVINPEETKIIVSHDRWLYVYHQGCAEGLPE